MKHLFTIKKNISYVMRIIKFAYTFQAIPSAKHAPVMLTAIVHSIHDTYNCQIMSNFDKSPTVALSLLWSLSNCLTLYSSVWESGLAWLVYIATRLYNIHDWHVWQTQIYSCKAGMASLIEMTQYRVSLYTALVVLLSRRWT